MGIILSYLDACSSFIVVVFPSYLSTNTENDMFVTICLAKKRHVVLCNNDESKQAWRTEGLDNRTAVIITHFGLSELVKSCFNRQKQSPILTRPSKSRLNLGVLRHTSVQFSPNKYKNNTWARRVSLLSSPMAAGVSTTLRWSSSAPQDSDSPMSLSPNTLTGLFGSVGIPIAHTIKDPFHVKFNPPEQMLPRLIQLLLLTGSLKF